jgi:hypothetical protein
MKSTRNALTLRLSEDQMTKLRILAQAMGVDDKQAAIASILAAFQAYGQAVERSVKEAAAKEAAVGND